MPISGKLPSPSLGWSFSVSRLGIVSAAELSYLSPRIKQMKVVIFCGGLGTRLREETEFRPKPMVPIGERPILWHIMKIYAHHGHKDFVLCLG